MSSMDLTRITIPDRFIEVRGFSVCPDMPSHLTRQSTGPARKTRRPVILNVGWLAKPADLAHGLRGSRLGWQGRGASVRATVQRLPAPRSTGRESRPPGHARPGCRGQQSSRAGVLVTARRPRASLHGRITGRDLAKWTSSRRAPVRGHPTTASSGLAGTAPPSADAERSASPRKRWALESWRCPFKREQGNIGPTQCFCTWT